MQRLSLFADASACDIWHPLTIGCGIVIVLAEEMKDASRVCQLISDHRIVYYVAVPSQLQVNILHGLHVHRCERLLLCLASLVR